MPPATPPRAGGRGRDYIPVAAWSRLLDAFRLTPGQAYAAATTAKVNYRTAEKAWAKGLRVRAEDGSLVDKPAISTIVQAQHEAARAAREVVARTAAQAPGGASAATSAPAVAMAIASGQVPAAGVRELAEADALAAFAEEARLVRVGRANVMGFVASMSSVTQGVTKLAMRVRVGLEELGAPAEPGEASPPLKGDELDQAVNLIGKAALMTKLACECVKHTLTAERMLVGSPAAAEVREGDGERESQIKRLLADLARHRRERRWAAVVQTEALLARVRAHPEPADEPVDAHVVVRQALVETIAAMGPEDVDRLLREEAELERLAAQATQAPRAS